MKTPTPRIITRSIGVLLVAAAVGSFGGYAWDQWGVNALSDRTQVDSAANLGKAWDKAPLVKVNDWDIPVLEAQPEVNEEFARLFIPAFGDTYVRPIAQGTDTKKVLDKIGIGHYLGTALPGEVGNFAIAAHRMTYGAAFRDLDLLNPGDEIIVETIDGWYTYKVDRSKIVKPTEVDVIADVPEKPGVAPSERWMTLTTCTPKWSAEKRLIVFTKFDSFTPRSEGAPGSIEAHVSRLDG